MVGEVKGGEGRGGEERGGEGGWFVYVPAEGMNGQNITTTFQSNSQM